MPRIATLHSFALSTLLECPARAALPQPLRVADDYEEREIIQQDLKGLLGLERVTEVRKRLARLSADWEQLTADGDTKSADPQFVGAWQEHRAVYGYTLRAELVYQLRNAFVEDSVSFMDPPTELMVDEYQDLNPCDLAVVRALADRGVTVFCAGDDDQSIYGFRSADPKGIRRFLKDFRPGSSFPLTLCMRCDRDILGLGRYVAEQDFRSEPKIIRPRPDAPAGVVRIARYKDQVAEADGVAELCQWLIRQRSVAPDDILVLTRSDHNGQMTKPIREALESRGVGAATASDPLALLNCPKDENKKEQGEGRKLLALIKLVSNGDDDLAWRTLLQLGAKGVGSSAIASLYDLARTQGARFAQVVAQVEANPAECPTRGSAVARAISAIRRDVERARALVSDDPLAFVRACSDWYVTDANTRQQVIEVFERVCTASTLTSLDALLRALHASLGQSEQDRQAGVVNVMTMHQAKGLSAHTVFVVGAERGFIPGRAKGSEADDERRLLYVSVTRARHLLVITHCTSRTGAQARLGAQMRGKRLLTNFLASAPVRSMDGSLLLGDVARNLVL